MKILSIDWNLLMWSSHPGTGAINLLKENSNVVVLANKCLPKSRFPEFEERVHRHLTVSDWHTPSKKVWNSVLLNTIEEARAKCALLSEELESYFATCNQDFDTIIVQDACLYNFIAVARFCIKHQIKVLFYFHTIRHRKFIRFFRRYIKKHKDLLFFAAIHPAISEQISQTLKHPVFSMPFPVEINSDKKPSMAPPFAIKLLGKNRVEKNWLMIPSLVDKLYPLFAQNRIVLHLPVELESSLAEFNADPVIREHICFHPIDLEVNYFDDIAESNIILLAYDPESYELRVSGVAEESIVCGIPFIITKNTLTWRTYKDCGNCLGFDARDPDDLAKAIFQMVENYPLFFNNASALSVDGIRAHSLKNYFDSLESIMA